MRAVIAAIHRFSELLKFWLDTLASWVDVQFFDKIVDFAKQSLKSITWLISGIIVIVGLLTESVFKFGGVMLSVASEIGAVAQDYADISIGSGYHQLHQAYAVGNYVFPLSELITFTVFFVGAKSAVSIARVLVKLYELLPFKMS